MFNVKESLHARLGPSNHRWPHCAGSVREEANYPDVAGEAAIDGTWSHILLELCLDNGCRAEDYEGQIIGVNHHDKPNGWMVHADRCKRVQMCLDYIHSRVLDLKKTYPNVSVHTESKADVGGMFGRTDWWGTVDITIICQNSQAQTLFVEVCDYKDGRGWVHAVDNTQLLAYMGGKLRPYIASGPDLVRPFHPQRVPNVRMTIVQPKTNPVVRYQDTTAEYVMTKVEWLATRARATDDPDAPLTPDGKGGKGYCRWCAHRTNCMAHSQQSMEVIKTMNPEDTQQLGVFEMLTKQTTDITTLSDDQLTKLMDTEAGVMAVYDKIRAEIEARIERGEKVNGFDMVDSRASKLWALPEEEMVKKFRAMKLTQDDYYPKKLASPAQILKNDKLTDKQKARVEKEFITVKAGPKKLGRVAYVREEKDVNTMFADIEKTTEDAGQSATSVVQSEVSFF